MIFEMRVIAIFLLVIFIFAFCVRQVSNVNHKGEATTGGQTKLIEWGWDMPRASYVRNNIATMEEKPFDGIAINIQYTWNNNLYNYVFGGSFMNFNDSALQSDISVIKATNFVKFTDNFLVVDISTNSTFIDWFDDWSRYIANIKVVAQAAKNAGLKGIILDTEMYHFKVWQYDQQKYVGSKTIDQYKAQAYLRGQQIMDAINSVYPGITILVTFGTGSVAYWQSKKWGWKPYELVVPFLDGMLSHMNTPSRIVSIFEPSYYFKAESDFSYAYNAITVTGKSLSLVPTQYDSFYYAGFALWLDYRSWQNSCPYCWSTTNLLQNYFTPDDFRKSVCLALLYSGTYVWIYSQKPNWWTGSNLPQAYIDALNQGKSNYLSGNNCQ